MEHVEEVKSERFESSESMNDEYVNYLTILQDKDSGDEKIKEIGEKFFDILRSINDDTKQLGEYLIEERNMVKAICTYLRRIFSQLNIAIILPNIPVPPFKTCKEIILNSQGHLIIVKEDDKVESRSLQKYPPEIVLIVIWGVIPKLKEIINAYMRQVSTRLDFFEKINEELKSVQESFEIPQEGDEEGSEDLRVENAREAIIPRK
jgi:hypothetical protein